MKKFIVIMSCILPSALIAEPHTGVWPEFATKVTIGEFLKIPPEPGKFSIMSLSCFHMLNPELDDLGLDDTVPVGASFTFDTSCDIPDEVVPSCSGETVISMTIKVEEQSIITVADVVRRNDGSFITGIECLREINEMPDLEMTTELIDGQVFKIEFE